MGADVKSAADLGIDLDEVETSELIRELESRGHDVDRESDLDDFSDDDLAIELQDRGGETPRNAHEVIVEMFEAFYLGKDEHAIAIARKLAQDTTGRMLV